MATASNILRLSGEGYFGRRFSTTSPIKERSFKLPLLLMANLHRKNHSQIFVYKFTDAIRLNFRRKYQRKNEQTGENY